MSPDTLQLVVGAARHLPLIWVEVSVMTLVFLVIWITYRAASYGDLMVLIVYIEISLLSFMIALLFLLEDRVARALTGFPSF